MVKPISFRVARAFNQYYFNFYYNSIYVAAYYVGLSKIPERRDATCVTMKNHDDRKILEEIYNLADRSHTRVRWGKGEIIAAILSCNRAERRV